jgi:hypothetical protein
MNRLLIPLLALAPLLACEEVGVGEGNDPPIVIGPDTPDAGGPECEADGDCPFGQVCDANVCRPPAPDIVDDGCLSDDDCGDDERCAVSTGRCIPAASFPDPPDEPDGPCEDGETRFCGEKTGACEYGTETCVDSQWSGVCEGGVGPTDEVCDGQDNDCNGETDELFVLGGPCADGQGVCQQFGVIVCAPDGLSTVCSATGLDPTGRVELCGNTLNDDCDADTDEGFTLNEACTVGVGACERSGVSVCSADLLATECSAAPGTPAPAELCGGDPDDNCNGTEEEGFENAGDACSVGVGACQRDGVLICNGARDGLVCSATPGTPLPFEICGDGIDNNCVGGVDEGFPGLGDACTFGVAPCQVSGSIGCSANGLATECIPDIPVGGAELCNGADDDNDTCVDEDFDVGASCVVGVGVCQASGNKICSVDEQGTECDAVALPPNPLGELCGNGLNDDCDADTDEGFLGLGNPCTAGVGACQNLGAFVCTADGTGIECSAVAGTPGTELCGNGINDDCDDETDEGFDDLGDFCAVGQGICQRVGVRVCAADGLATECSAVEGAPDPLGEICGNGLDDDCNGLDDDGFDVGAPCTVGFGICERSGVKICAPDGRGTVCDATPGPAHPDGELCQNGEDDDCDNAVDEGFANLGQPCTAGLGECRNFGTFICSADLTTTQCSALPDLPQAEACDDLDNDCNGTPDNGCDDDGDEFCDANLAFAGSPAICPRSDAANLDCDDGDANINPGATEICFDARDQNCDGNNNDGCNCNINVDRDFDGSNECDDCDDTNGAINPDATELCDGVDNNCKDGIDEGFDADSDTFTICGTLPAGGTAPEFKDCNDNNPIIFPGACELCADVAGNTLTCGDLGDEGNGVDEDCDGFLDENCTPCDPADRDGDGLSECEGDCAPDDGTVAPNLAEVCDGKDTDCNVNTIDNCVVGDDCDHPPDTDVCEEGLFCVESLGGGGNPTGNFTCTSSCNYSELGAGLGDGCAANQICGASLTPSANQHGCQVATDIGALLSGAVCSDDADCRSGDCLNDPRTVGPPDRFCTDFCGSDAYCQNGTKCMNLGDTGRCFPVLASQDLGFDDVCQTARAFECESRACVEFAAGDPRCTDVCCDNGDCPAGFHCGVEGTGSAGPIGGVDTVPVCMPDDAGNGGRQAGAACSTNDQCAGQFCDANLGVCVDVCCNDNTCPAGLTCEDALVNVDLQNISGQSFVRMCLNQTPADPLEKTP